MKLNTQDRTVIRHGVSRESTFKIAANAQAFDILSSKLYTDPKLAIVRELSTNAYDAQVEAGTHEKPFLVHLPNDFETYFSIRDFGTGLSPKAIESIYTTYFASTRNESDEYTGALGLGSKSPFAYTEQFTVTSYHNGTAYTYSAFKSERGEPSIALMGEQPTVEPNGVEIKITVKPYDCADFGVAARKVYQFFPVKPTITGRRVDFPTAQPTHFNDEYALFTEPYHTVGMPGRLNVVMGNICYAITSDKIKSRFSGSATVVIFMPIGECQIAASREELHYDPATIAKVQDRLDAAAAEVQKHVDDELKTCATLIERMVKLTQYRHLLDLSYANVIIKTHKDNVYKLRRLDIKGDKLFMGQDRWSDDIDPNWKCMFIRNDVGELAQKDKNRLRHLISQTRATSPGMYNRFFLADIQDEPAFEGIFGQAFVAVSKLPDPPRNANGRVTTGSRSFIREYTGYHNVSEAWKSVKVDTVDNTQVIAVPRRGNYVIFNGNVTQPHHAMEIAKLMGYSQIYAITERYFAKIREELDLAELTEEAKTFAVNTVGKMTVSDFARMQHSWDRYSFPDGLMKAIQGLSTVCNDLVSMSKSKDCDSTLHQLMRYFDIKAPKVSNPVEAFKQRYPLIARIDLQYASITDVVEYITLKEAKIAAEEAA